MSSRCFTPLGGVEGSIELLLIIYFYRFTTYSIGNLPATNWQVSCPSSLCSNSKLGAKEVLCSSRISSIDPFTPPKCVMHLGDSLVHTSPGYCIPVFNSSSSVKILFSELLTQHELNVTFLSINSTPSGQNSFKSCCSTS